jgi:hypothetical protein
MFNYTTIFLRNDQREGCRDGRVADPDPNPDPNRDPDQEGKNDPHKQKKLRNFIF